MTVAAAGLPSRSSDTAIATPVIVGAALVLLAGLAWIFFGPRDVLPPYVLGLVTGMASGAAMVPCTVIKEANPPDVSGTTTGVVGFLNFSVSALLGPVFAGRLLGAGDASDLDLGAHQTTSRRSSTESGSRSSSPCS